MNYTGAHCPVCDKRFTHSDDIVVCPVCGAPHHRECYQQENRCALEHLHMDGHTWQAAPNTDKDESGTSQEATRVNCWFCGADNPSDGLFCQSCGSSLKKGGAVRQQPQQSSAKASAPPVFENIFKGMSPDDEIEGVSVRDLSLFTGNNSHYFLYRFHKMKEGQKLFPNLAAMFFHQFYYLFRKMYMPALILLGLSLISQIPMLVVLPEFVAYLVANMDIIMQGFIPPEFIPTANAWLLDLSQYLRMGVLIVQFIMSFYANRIYFLTAKKRIQKIKASFTKPGVPFDDVGYTKKLSQSGNVSFVIPILYAIGFSVIYTILIAIYTFFLLQGML